MNHPKALTESQCACIHLINDYVNYTTFITNWISLNLLHIES